MKDKTTLTPVLEKLEDLFSKLNSEFYGGKLQAPVITISPDTTKGAYQAAAVLKEICNRRTEDDSCHKCPFYAMCCAEPYSWEIPEGGGQ